jgi:hypothetical protein
MPARRRGLIPLAACHLLALVMLPAIAGAQVRPRPTVSRPPATTQQPNTPQQPGDRRIPRAPGDTSRAPEDSARPPLVKWVEDDSIMIELLRRSGYTVVRYQAQDVGFAAAGRTMTLTGTDSAKAAVQRDSTVLVADSIRYSDSTKVIAARGDTIIMREPSQRGDVIGLREFSYDVERREGLANEFRTVASAGEDWQVTAHRAAFVSDSASDRNTVYGRDGRITSCLDSVPHYHFRAKDLKRVSGNVLVARPAVLYLHDVPVLWLPFIFQDIRTGRRSGLLTPRLGVAELVRNSPTYRRRVENLGYYFAFSDYVDAQLSMDWMSSARAAATDQPGWLAVNGELRYRWLDRFLSGTLALSRTSLSSGSKSTQLSWGHTQEFSSSTRFTSNLNYTTSTQIQRTTNLNPALALAAISSTMNLTRTQGPLNINLGGNRRQYPGRDKVEQTFPSLNVSSKPIAFGEWFLMTPSLTFSRSDVFNLDQVDAFTYRYIDVGGVRDSVKLDRNTSQMSTTVGTPFRIFGLQVNTGFRFHENVNDFPALRVIVDPADTSRRIERIYDKTFLSSADFDVSIGLPGFFAGSWNLAPSITASNVAPDGGFFVRSERTSGQWVAQSKRLSYGVGVSPTFYGLLPGFGPVLRFRHAISPTLSYGYSPAAEVSDEFLAALGRSPGGFLGTLAQNRINLGLSTNIEAKIRTPGDSTGDEGTKVKVLSVQFTPISYDFERARATGQTGLSTDRFGYSLRSELLPGLDFSVDYSLFQGYILSDTAKFDPYRESMRATFSLNQGMTLVRSIARLLGANVAATPKAAPGAAPPAQQPIGGNEYGTGAGTGLGAMTGTRARNSISEIPSGLGFQASFTFSSSRTRPAVGGTTYTPDPTLKCEPLRGTVNYEPCVAQARLEPVVEPDQNETTAGGAYRMNPPRSSLGFQTGFNLTPSWAAAWGSSYDFERNEFASHAVTLQRDLHDWRAIFGFTKSPNGSFSFTFFISLKAQPEIKVDYDRHTYRPSTISR